jgi:hypothetical protein
MLLSCRVPQMLKVLILIPLPLLFAALSYPQQARKPPLVISNQSQQGAIVSFDLTNTSAKPVRADVITCAMKPANGQRGVVKVQQTAIYGLGADVLVPPAFHAGLTHHEQFRAATPNASGPCKLSVDYVLFTDGSSWGPDAQKSSQAIRAVLSGYNAAIMNLQTRLTQGGEESALQYIRGFQPGPDSGYNTALTRLQSKLKQSGADPVLRYIREFKPIR